MLVINASCWYVHMRLFILRVYVNLDRQQYQKSKPKRQPTTTRLLCTTSTYYPTNQHAASITTLCSTTLYVYE